MATEVEEAPAAVAPARPSGGGVGTVKIVGIVLTVVVVQGIVTFFLLPAPAMAPDSGEVEETTHADVVEVPIDRFSSTNETAKSHSVHVSVQVVAVVSSDQEVAFNEAANREHKARVRQAINQVIRAANMAELTEASWGTMRRRMREEINKLLQKSYVIEIVFPHYQAMEQ